MLRSTRYLMLLVMLLCVGCATPPATDRQTLRTDLDAAIQRAADYLESQQADNGSWPSDTYGLFRDGVALSPHVLRSLTQANRTNEATVKAASFIFQHIHYELPTGASNGGFWMSEAVRGPVYFCADAYLALKSNNTSSGFLQYGLKQELKKHQIGSNYSDRVFAQKGGWGYGIRPMKPLADDTIFRVRFDHGKCMADVAPNLSANISATVYALDALAPPLDKLYRDTRYEHGPVLHPATRFAIRCQNFGTGDKRYDDGGFFFNPADPARNKGGPAGTDKDGYARFHSAGSSTADGLRALLLCRVPKDHPRVVAARDWLFKHFDAERHPGTFNADRAILRDAYYFYYAASVADTFTLLGQGPDDWAQQLAAALIKRQNTDGSFANPYTDGKEDDPLIATPFALRSLVACRAAIRNN